MSLFKRLLIVGTLTILFTTSLPWLIWNAGEKDGFEAVLLEKRGLQIPNREHECYYIIHVKRKNWHSPTKEESKGVHCKLHPNRLWPGE